MDKLDPSSIRIDPRYETIGTIYKAMCDKRLILPGVYDDRTTWSKLIESILVQIPLPTFYFDEDVHGAWRVIDGVRRLRAIQGYISNKYPLEGLEYLDDTVCFDKLHPWQQRRILGTTLSLQITNCATPSDVRFNIFRRIQSVRHHMETDAWFARKDYLGLEAE